MKRGWALALATFVALSVVPSACSSAAPTPTQAPAAPAKGAESAKPAVAAKGEAPKPAATGAAKTEAPAAKPAATGAAKSGTSEAKPAASSDWKAVWDKTVAAAKQEGKVTVAGPTGDLYRETAMAFQKVYPEIQMEFTAVEGPTFAPKILAERGGGQFLWDVHVGGAQTALNVFKPQGILDPLKPSLILPDVLDDTKWLGGLDNFWQDQEARYVFGFQAVLQHSIFVNRDVVKESELSNHEQLLDPRWKGKIVSGDLTTSGAANGSVEVLIIAKGEEWLRKFYAQDIAIMKDERAVVESLVRGRYPLAVGFKPSSLQVFRQEGAANHVKPLDPDGPGGAGLSTGSSHAMLINKAPHPNAATLFLNWLLSKEGQQTFVNVTDLTSPRADVAGGDPFFKPTPNVKYPQLGGEPMFVYKTKAMDLAKEVFK